MAFDDTVTYTNVYRALVCVSEFDANAYLHLSISCCMHICMIEIPYTRTPIQTHSHSHTPNNTNASPLHSQSFAQSVNDDTTVVVIRVFTQIISNQYFHFLSFFFLFVDFQTHINVSNASNSDKICEIRLFLSSQHDYFINLFVYLPLFAYRFLWMENNLSCHKNSF